MTAQDIPLLNEAEIMRLRLENRARSKEIRRCMADLVKRRLAREITYEQYAASRSVALLDRAECDRQLALLNG